MMPNAVVVFGFGRKWTRLCFIHCLDECIHHQLAESHCHKEIALANTEADAEYNNDVPFRPCPIFSFIIGKVQRTFVGILLHHSLPLRHRGRFIVTARWRQEEQLQKSEGCPLQHGSAKLQEQWPGKAPVERQRDLHHFSFARAIFHHVQPSATVAVCLPAHR